MRKKGFDKKFGERFCADLPITPGVYRFYDTRQRLIYVGKAKNLRRRLQSYRNAGLKKKERKMLLIVREATRLEFEVAVDEQAALLRETELIQEHRPVYNVEGAYDFLYPAIGVGIWDAHLLLGITTDPDAFSELSFSWFGVFRSRPRAKIAFDALCTLLAITGHQEQRNRLPKVVSPKGSSLRGFRQISAELQENLPWFLAGKEADFLTSLAKALLEKPYALRHSSEIETQLQILKIFYGGDAQKLKQELAAVGRPGSFIRSNERDALSIRAKFA